MLTPEAKNRLKAHVAQCLRSAPEIRKVIVFGSFVSSDDPEDMDIAVFLDNEGSYLPLALKYRKMTRPVAKQIPLDIVPVRPNATGPMLSEIESGEVIYER